MPLGMLRARLEAKRTQTAVCHCRFATVASSMPLGQGRAVSLGGPVGLARRARRRLRELLLVEAARTPALSGRISSSASG